MKNYIGRMVMLVNDYEAAADFYETNFGFKRLHDVTTDVGQRFLHIGTNAVHSMGIWFLRATSAKDKTLVGNQTNGQPVMVIYTDSLVDLCEKLKARNVTIKIEPVLTPGYHFFHCLDLYGNEIVVVQLKN